MDASTPPARLLSLLENVAYSKRPCRFCDRLLYFVRVNGGTTVPYTAEGTSHFGNCPHRPQPAPYAQESPFGETQPEAFEPRR